MSAKESAQMTELLFYRYLVKWLNVNDIQKKITILLQKKNSCELM